MRSSAAALLLSVLLISAGPARAQERAPTTAAATPMTAAQHLAPAASLLFAPATLERSTTPVLAMPALSRNDGLGMMIAGGALFVAGLVVGGDAGTLMAVGGAGVGAYGLYLYFR